MESAVKIKVLIVDDHEVVCRGTKLLIEEDPQMSVVGLATDGHIALELAKQLEPDVILMDINLPELNGIQATALIKQVQPAAKIIAFTGYEQEQYIAALSRAGASGFLPKTVSQEKLTQGIKDVYNGSSIFCSPAGNTTQPNYSANPNIELTNRELDILKLLAKGLSNKEIGTELALSTRTIEFHIGNLLSKLKSQSRLSAVLEARRLGLIDSNI